ncbi:hypothetical protein Pelo_5055 [Pelomyxa schiedti]|nr:hypothetical protein Pelo_5055 [Pelomyxa schiedti]
MPSYRGLVVLSLATWLLGSTTAATLYDSCVEAYQIDSLPFSFSGSTVQADSSTINCNYTTNPSNQGIYFKYTPQSHTYLVASTCDQTVLDTVIFAFTGCSEDGVASSCVAYNDDGCLVQSKASWSADAGITYYIVVMGFKGATGEFTFSLNETEVNKNDQCSTAEAITSMPFTFTGDNLASDIIYSSCRKCDALGFWFSVIGTGDQFTARTCEHTYLDTVIELYSDCDGTCISYNDDSCLFQSELSWRSVPGVTYYIFVGSFNLQTGLFTLSIDSVAIPAWQNCQTALLIDVLPFSTTSSTDYVSTSYSTCTESDMNALWYTIVGTGDQLAAWTCILENQAYDTILEVYSSCDETAIAQGCIVRNDDFCGLNAKVVWNTEAGKPYYISVSGPVVGLKGVPFSLSVDLVSNGDNSLCWSATPVSELPAHFSQSTADAELSETFCAISYPPRPGRWFELNLPQPPENKVVASVCNTETTTAFAIEVYGNCGMMGCTTKSDPKECNGKGVIELEALSDTSYYVFATAGEDLVGDFAIDLYEENSDPHSECDNAYPVPVPSTTEGFTSPCYYSYSPCKDKAMKGIWFNIKGTGKIVTASTCSPKTDFDTYISVVQSCANITNNCVKSGDDHCGNQAQVSWPTEAGVPYYILVSGYADESGRFEFILSEEPQTWIPKN